MTASSIDRTSPSHSCALNLESQFSTVVGSNRLNQGKAECICMVNKSVSFTIRKKFFFFFFAFWAQGMGLGCRMYKPPLLSFRAAATTTKKSMFFVVMYFCFVYPQEDLE